MTEPTAEQRRLLEVIWETYPTWDRWPIYQYVDQTLYREGIDANSTLLSCPILRWSGYGRSRYGWIWTTGNEGATADDDRIGLTVVGMHWLDSASGEVSRFIRALGALVSSSGSFRPSPAEVQVVTVTSEQLQPLLSPFRPPEVRRLGEVLRHEPATMPFISQPDEMGSWTATLDSRIRAYSDVQDVPQYAERLEELVAPRIAVSPTPVSSLALPEAIDYLNAIWHLRFRQELFDIPRFAGAVELTHDCQTSADFDSRVTALYGVFSAIRIPNGKQHAKPADLKKFLARHAVLRAQPGAIAAVDAMDTFLRARAWRHHIDATDGMTAMGQLGVKLPIADPEDAWRAIRTRMVECINALREEVDVLPIPPH